MNDDYFYHDQLINKITTRPPEKFERRSDVIPFHIPHKKLLERIEHQRSELEPLTGFKDAQESLIRRRKCPSEPSKAQLLDLEPLEITKCSKLHLCLKSNKPCPIHDQNELIDYVQTKF